MHYLETPQEKEMRAREQANIDEDRKEKKKDFDRWQEKFAVDFAKGMDCIYQLVSQTIAPSSNSSQSRAIRKYSSSQSFDALRTNGVRHPRRTP
jgi:hypothetical protein